MCGAENPNCGCGTPSSGGDCVPYGGCTTCGGYGSDCCDRAGYGEGGYGWGFYGGSPPPVPPPPPKPVDPKADLRNRIKMLLGFFGGPFRDVFTGGDQTYQYDLSETNVKDVIAAVLDINNVRTELTEGSQYFVDPREGKITLRGALAPLPRNKWLVVEGVSTGPFSDEDLDMFIDDAVAQQGFERTITTRYMDECGFIKYMDMPYSLQTMPSAEVYPLALLACTMVLWTLLLDAATDIDIHTAEGTTVLRTQRYHQLMEMQGAMEARYREISLAMGIGLYRVQVYTLRRISKTTNRLVPLFRPREYDDNHYPMRLLPPIDAPYPDCSGVPSPIWPGVWF